jgi:glycosyltransferase involved in cell wall biosynthesis
MLSAARRTVLFLAYHFPPIGGAAAQRVVQVLRRLPDYGYDPLVVTGPGGTKFRWAPLDGRVGDDLEKRCEVRRLSGPEPARDRVWEGRLERWVRIAPAWERWWSRGVLTAVHDIAAEVDLIHATVAPYQTASSVRRVARELDVPLVVDLEDPWALDEMMVYPTALHRRLERRRMRRTLEVADAIVMNTPEAARRVRNQFPSLRDHAVTAVPNAFDADDFASPSPETDPGTFRIVHTGSLHTDFGVRHRRRSLPRRIAGGAVPGVDFLTRSHVFLLKALADAKRLRPDLVERVELHFAGVLTYADMQAMEGSPVAVEVHGFLPHPKTIALVRSADLLFLPLHDVAPGTRVGIVPQKTYEYIASGRPILAAVPPGDARDAVAARGAAHVCEPADTDAMAAAVIHELQRWAGGERPPPTPPSVLERYDSQRLAADIARVYDDALRRRGMRSGAGGARALPGETRVAAQGPSPRLPEP